MTRATTACSPASPLHRTALFSTTNWRYIESAILVTCVGPTTISPVEYHHHQHHNCSGFQETDLGPFQLSTFTWRCEQLLKNSHQFFNHLKTDACTFCDNADKMSLPRFLNLPKSVFINQILLSETLQLSGVQHSGLFLRISKSQEFGGRFQNMAGLGPKVRRKS